MNKPVKLLPEGNKLAKLAPIYLKRWENLESYPEQEKTLGMLFRCWDRNEDFDRVMVKVATLDKFYSTQLRSVVDVSKHIQSIPNFDNRLKDGDLRLVDEICTMKNYTPFSFASKYCSWGNPEKYPIYDKYVALVLSYYRDKDSFTNIKVNLSSTNSKKSYENQFYPIIKAFRDYYGLTKYSFKELDRFIWLFGKEHFGGKFDLNLYKSAQIGDYTINIEKFGSVLVYNKSVLLSNSKQALREVIELLDGLEWDSKWITQQAGRKIVNYAIEHPDKI